jgi:DNA primase
VSGRALETSDRTLRYVTLRTDESTNKLIYGTDRVDLTKRVYLVEGPIDSLFLNNCVASGDANLALTAKELLKMGAKSVTLVPDREPRNREIVKLINKFVQDGFDVCLLPDTIEGKDINEIVLEGIEPNNLQTIIDEHTFSGVNLHLEFMMWKKI